MRTIISLFALSALAVSLSAQVPAVKTAAPAAEKKTAAAVKAPAPEAKSAKTAAAAQASKKQSETEPDEGTVMIDSKAEQEENGRIVMQSDDNTAEREVNVPGGLPSSYGQCKGVISEGGRNLLVFESPDDGAIYFVQVTLGKNGAAWKLVSRIPRSAD